MSSLVVSDGFIHVQDETSLRSYALRRLADRIPLGDTLVIRNGEMLPRGGLGLITRSEKKGVYRRVEQDDESACA